jgi:glycyl-tRNA synthetase beta subunit
MKLLEIILEIPDMPIVDQKSSVVFAKELNILLQNHGINTEIKYNHSKDFMIFTGIIKSNIAKTLIKGPKTGSSGEIFFRSKYQSSNFIIKDEYVFAEYINYDLKSIILECFFNTMKTHQWSIGMTWNDSKITCCRPINNISIKYDNQYLNGAFANVKFSHCTSEINNFSEKFQNLQDELLKLDYLYNSEFINNFLIYLIDKPKIIIVDFDKKFLVIPEQIIKDFLQKEQMSVLLYKNNKAVNKVLCIIEDGLQINIKNFQLSIEAKLLDLYLQYRRDITKPIETYIIERNHKVINEKLGTISDKISRMKSLLKTMPNLKHIEHDIDLYNLDITSETVQETPSMIGIIAKELITDYNKYDHEIRLLEYIDNLIEFAKLGFLPTANKDQFGLKKQCDFIIEYLMQNELNIDFGEAEDFFNQRLRLKIEKINPDLLKLKFERRFLYKYIDYKINHNGLIRIINLVSKSKCNQYIELHSIEKTLLEKVEKLSLENLNETISELTHFIDNTQISPYNERLMILEEFLKNFTKLSIDY